MTASLLSRQHPSAGIFEYRNCKKGIVTDALFFDAFVKVTIFLLSNYQDMEKVQKNWIINDM